MKSYPIPITKEEMSKLINASMENEFYYVLFMAAKTTGRRLGEYYDVMVKDITERQDGSKFLVTKVLKRGRRVEKEAVLSDEVYRLLQVYIKKNKLGLDDYVFKKVSKRAIQHAVKRYGKIAGIQHNVMFHNFRHYFVTELVRMGWTYDKIAKLTGHLSLSTLLHYDHAIASDIKDEALKAIKNL